jgi:hypothetical protein
MCLDAKHTLTNEGEMQGMKPNDSQVHSNFGICTCARVANVQTLVGKVNKHKIGP